MGKREIKYLKNFNKIFKNKIPSITTFTVKLTDLGFDKSEIRDLYNLYLNNYREDGDYENLEELKTGDIFADSIKKVINDNVSVDEIEEMFNNPIMLGDYFYGPGSWKEPRVEFNVDGIYLHLNHDDWEKYFSGLDQEDTWYYNLNDYNHEEYVDDEEFDYSLRGYPQEYMDNLLKLTQLVGDFEFYNDITNDKFEDGQLTEFLETFFPKKVKDIIRDYTTEMSIVQGEVRIREVDKCYQDNVKFSSKDREDIFIPWEDLLEIVIEKDLFTLSDLKNAEINGDGFDLSECYYQSYPSDEELEPVYKSLNDNIEKLIEDLEDGDFEGTGDIQNSKKMFEIINKLGFKRDGNKFTKTMPNGIEFKILSFNTGNGTFTINIEYPEKYGSSKWDQSGSTENKTVHYDELGTVISSIPLDRQVEGLNRKKKLTEDVFHRKLIGVVENFLNRLDMIEMRPSETDEYTWYLEFYSEQLEEFVNKEQSERFFMIYSINGKNDLNRIDKEDNENMIKLICDFINFKMDIDDEEVYFVVKNYLEKTSKNYLHESGIDIKEPHAI